MLLVLVLEALCETAAGLDFVSIVMTKKHLRGTSDKEQRQYEHIKESAEKSGRYGKRATEVAARTVMKQHGRKKAAKKR